MNVKIRSIEIEHPQNVVKNEFYVKLFKEQGKDIRRMLECFGKSERKVVNNNSDTTVTLGVKAALKALESANLTGNDIDIIIFSSQFPEYTCPTQALIVHDAIGGKEDAMVMDLNVNCIGMLVALDSATRYLLQNHNFKRALIIGADYATIHAKKTDEFVYPMFGDCGCAIILEKTEEDCGMIDSTYYTESPKYDSVVYPKCGASSFYKNTTSHEDMKLGWTECDDNVVYIAKNSINKLLKNNNLKVSDIKAFCFSQFASSLVYGCADILRIEEEKVIYVGDKYGYTGTSSPLIALYEGIKKGQIKRGDKIMFWSIAATRTACALLFKY
ncbi:3-oxoacyl-[acyl-carrier-protein] synthase III C-terminal domain-containing protein [Clostridium weizhouense]|uniref:3-oxoacyl-ACP synthase III family protein n=1 Tax=Clostridium weizhouense TaxID=2859781 RepID=A0ABS7AJ84_9CLOT|nr:3-oxoacyl-ACP synthase III family protein [Clostridium weizhouense]MBW6408722.1 3-oxoacyl-ACP synthase III family protein [Clostridium weizhouense]